MKLFCIAIILLSVCSGQAQNQKGSSLSEPELKRISYISELDSLERDFFLYLPKGYYNDTSKQWPIVMHLHGNGERGNGKEDLKWVTKHGPLMEAWVQKRDFPFILIVPQLHMLGMDTIKSYIANRDATTIPKRITDGIPGRIPIGNTSSFQKPEASPLPYPKEGNIRGWYLVENDLLKLLSLIQHDYRGDKKRSYLTGLSYGGFGTWYMAGSNPKTFAAIVPVCGWGHPDIMKAIAAQKIPTWCFAGEKDDIIQLQHFYPGFKKLDALNFKNYKFTIVPNVGHDVWKPVYQGEKVYDWLLKHALND